MRPADDRSAARLAEVLASRRRTVLVVEDDPAIREGIGVLLELEGYAVSLVADGLAALAFLRESPLPDAILLDLEMPRMPGWEFRAAQAADPALAAVPVLVVSSSPRQVPAQRRLPKPFDPEELLAAVREIAGAP